jgi:HD-GYP domain-containing protein (c-di-GMP phosphodiesterase class II)
MRSLPVEQAIGLRLARNVPAPDPRQLPILRANATVTERYATALAGMGIRMVWVRDELSEGIEPAELLTPAVRQEAARTVTTALTGARDAFTRGTTLPKELLDQLDGIVAQIASSVAAHPGVALVLSDLASADAYTHQHSIDVCALGILLGRNLFARNGWVDDRGRRRFEEVDRRLHLLGLGLLLHDVGKLAIPNEILTKPGPLTAEETAVVRTHAEAGAELLSGDAYSPVVRAIVREHHERWDGQGYPEGLSGTGIHQLARICAVADVYDAVTSERHYKPAQPPSAGVAVILDGRGTAFDPEVVDVFAQTVQPYPVGSQLRLVDGSTGVVASIDPERPRQPIVRFPDGERAVEEAELLAA